jgi:hypothetical protein
MTCPPGHIDYLSAATTSNALALRRVAHPWCEGMHSWACGDHFHIGHDSPAIGDRCKARDAERWADRQERRRA